MTWIHEAVTNMLNHIHPATLVEKKRRSLQLEQFRNFNFGSMRAELGAVFSNSDGIQLRHVPLAYRVALDGGRQYARRPRREWSGASSAQAKAWEDLYRELRVDRTLLGAEQAGVLQQACLIGYWPDASGARRLHRFLPFQVVDVRVGAQWSGDIADADRVVLARSIPDPKGSSSPLARVQPWVALFDLTPDEAWLVLPDSQRIGLFAPSGKNQLGRIPLCWTKRAEPVDTDEDMILPAYAEDVASCQIGINLILSDAEATMRRASRVKVIVTGNDADALPKKMPDVTGTWLVLPGEVTATPVPLDPPLEKYLRAGETTLHYLTQFRYLRPEAYQASIVTGEARRADAEGFLDETERQEGRCQVLEEDLARLIADVERVSPRALALGNPEVRVTFRYVETQANVLQRQQALAVQLANLMTSHVEEVARDKGISDDAARDLLAQRAADMVDRIGSAGGATRSTPGLDRSAPPAAQKIAERNRRLTSELGGSKPATEAGTSAGASGSAAAPAAPTQATASPPSLDAGGDVQKAALNGAQVQAMGEILDAVARGQRPLATARAQLLASFPLDAKAVDDMLAPLAGFRPQGAAPTPAGGAA